MTRLNNPSVVFALLVSIVSMVGLAAMPMVAMAEEIISPCDQIKVVGVELERLGKTLQTESNLDKLEEAMREAPGEPWILVSECQEKRWELTSGMKVDIVPTSTWWVKITLSNGSTPGEDGAHYYLDFTRTLVSREEVESYIRVRLRNTSNQTQQLALKVGEYCEEDERIIISPLMTKAGETEEFRIPICNSRWRYVSLKPAIAAPTAP